MMEQGAQYIQAEFRRLVAAAVKEGLDLLKPLLVDKRQLSRYFNWPDMSVSKSGMPSFSKSLFSGPIDYKSAFGGKDSAIPVEDIASFQSLLSLVECHVFVRRRLLHPGMVAKENDPELRDWVKDHLKFAVNYIPEELVDRYIHLYGTCEFSEDFFEEIYRPYALCLFGEELYLDICVPILFLKFDSDQIELGPNVGIERMGEEFQLARAPVSEYAAGVHESVLPAATHMLVLRNWFVKNPDVFTLSETTSDINVYPHNHIDSFFAAIRIVTGHLTGYAQLLMRPKGWAHQYKADLPPLAGTSTKAYPSKFEKYYWLNEDVPVLDKGTALEVGRLFIKLLDVGQNSVHIAVRRLNLCFLRDDDNDSILDATIGLEALLSDDNRQEMTHKLAMRVGALAKSTNRFASSPYQVFRNVKEIYTHRSAVVHGSKEAHKRREIVQDDNRPMPVTSLAIEYLRTVLRIVLDYPQYRQPSRIDEELLIGGDQTTAIT